MAASVQQADSYHVVVVGGDEASKFNISKVQSCTVASDLPFLQTTQVEASFLDSMSEAADVFMYSVGSQQIILC